MTRVDLATVRRLAERAQIDVASDVMPMLAEQLSAMVDWFDQMPVVQSTAPAATAGACREDEPVQFDSSRLLAGAPAVRDRLFDVPTRSLPVEKKDETTPATPAAPATPEKPLVEMSAFQQLDLRSGRVVEAGPHPAADRLLVLKVDVGEERPRTVVAGIAPYYPDPSVLVGRTLIVVCNLVPAKLRGVMSEAMLLAAGGKEHCGLVTVQEACPPGTLVR